MANMSYCRFQNTFNDLEDCFDSWDEDLSDREEQFRDKLLHLCEDIVENFSAASLDHGDE